MNKKRWLALLMAFVMLIGVFPMTALAEDHVHSDGCYAEAGDLLCSLEESDGHTHGESCYCTGGEYVCGLEGTGEHTHTSECICLEGELRCLLEESDGHVHGAGCYYSADDYICEPTEAGEHIHTDECICQGGELICLLEESEGHAHGENCYAKGGELICGQELSLFGDNRNEGLGVVGSILNAQDFLNAVTNANSGDTLLLGADIEYNQSILGSISIEKNITLDCNGYKITVDDALFEITNFGSLTLVNAQLESTDDDIIDNNYGTLVIESTAGIGIVTDDDFIDSNYGHVIIKSGTFYPGYSLIYDNNDNAEVMIENAYVEAEDCIIGYLNDNGCSLTIKNGTFKAEYIISQIRSGNAFIENGSYESLGDSIDDIQNGTLIVKNGSFFAGNADSDSSCFDVSGIGVLNVEGGQFESNGNTIYSSDSAVINLKGGTFTNTSGGAAIYIGDTAKVFIAEEYRVDPENWKESGTDKIRVYPNIIEVVFLGTDGIEIYREAISYNTSVSNWPETPTPPSEEYYWWGWMDSAGNRYSSDDTFVATIELQAKFVKEGLPVSPDEEPVEPDDESEEVIMPEKPTGDAVIVTSYDELKAAIETGKEYINVSGSITFPKNGTLFIQSDTYITGVDEAEISGSGIMFEISYDVTVTVENLNINASTGNVFRLDSNATVNIVSGQYSAPDDVLMYGTVNLFSGTLIETENSDGPIYRSMIHYMNHTKDGNENVSIIEVVPCEKYMLTLYNGETVIRKEELYEGDVYSLPEGMGSEFIGWFDADGIQHYTGAISSNLTLYAKFRQENVTVTFVMDDDERQVIVGYDTALSDIAGFDETKVWKDKQGIVWNATSVVTYDIVLYATEDFDIVMTYDELLAAVSGNNDTIVIGTEILMEDTVTIDRSLNISAINNGSLVRAESNAGYLLSIVTEGETATKVTIGNLLIDGQNIEAEEAAVSVDNMSLLYLRGTTIRNNYNASNSGGAVYTLGKVYIYEGTSLCNNKAILGGAVCVDCNWNDTTACLYLYGGDICHNHAWDTSGCDGAGGGVQISDAYTEDYVAFYMYGGRIHHNKAEQLNDDVWNTSSGGGVSLCCGDNGVHFVMYGGEITDNFATGEGGAVYTGCSSMSMYDGVMARNVALEKGGAVSTDCCDNVLFMYGGVITLNAAAEGGGVYAENQDDPYLLTGGNIYGNLAYDTGDDIKAGTRSRNLTILRTTNDAISCDNPYYIESEMQEFYKELARIRPDYTIMSPIDGYSFENKIDSNSSIKPMLKFLGWYNDGGANSRYKVSDSPIVSGSSTTFVLSSDQDAKAVYGGFFLVYDANNNTDDYQYDSEIYWNENAVTQNCMFTREGYQFVGWNTKADGSGNWYYPNFNGYNQIRMNSNKVLYAQWSKQYVVTYVVNGDEHYGIPVDGVAPIDENNPYNYNEQVHVHDNLTSAWTTSDGTTAGIPGTWVFTPWDKEDFRITEDTIITGSWRFSPAGGSLIISKTVSGDGADTTKGFTFTITLSDSAVSGTYGEITFENGIAVFALKDGESKTALNLPVGINYTVEESDNTGYTVTVNDSTQAIATGTIVANTTAKAAFNNHKSGDDGNIPVVNPATVTIKAQKTLDGNAAVGSNYSFVLMDESGNIIQTVQNHNGDITFAPLSFEQTGTYTYTLSEVVGSDRAIIYDTTVYKIVVEVTKSGDYEAVVSYEKDGDVYNETPVFANRTASTDDTDETIEVSVSKVWNDGVGVSRPSSVSVQLYKNGTAYGEPVILSAENNWSHTWSQLDSSAAWTVDEVHIPDGYSKTVTHSGNHWTITNTRNVLPDTPDKPDAPDKPDKPVDRAPQTGDSSKIELWIVLACVSMVAMLALVLFKKRFSTRK